MTFRKWCLARLIPKTLTHMTEGNVKGTTPGLTHHDDITNDWYSPIWDDKAFTKLNVRINKMRCSCCFAQKGFELWIPMKHKFNEEHNKRAPGVVCLNCHSDNHNKIKRLLVEFISRGTP